MKKLFIPKTPYTIFAESDGFSFGIDAVLLSEFAKMKKGRVMAEIGAGTGFVSMRCFSLYRLKKVYGVEIQEENIRLYNEQQNQNYIERQVKRYTNLENRSFDNENKIKYKNKKEMWLKER